MSLLFVIFIETIDDMHPELGMEQNDNYMLNVGSILEKHKGFVIRNVTKTTALYYRDGRMTGFTILFQYDKMEKRSKKSVKLLVLEALQNKSMELESN